MFEKKLQQHSLDDIFQAQQGNSPFKRQFSLRLTELPSTLERQKMSSTLQQPPSGGDDQSTSSSGILADDPMFAKLGLDNDIAQQQPTLKSTPNSGRDSYC